MDAEMYRVVSEPAPGGRVVVERVADKKRAEVKASWVRRTSEDSELWMPASRTKAIRLKFFAEWK
jgi:hypothetical protein